MNLIIKISDRGCHQKIQTFLTNLDEDPVFNILARYGIFFDLRVKSFKKPPGLEMSHKLI